MVGHMASAWVAIQERYYHTISSQCSATLWSVQLCRQLIQSTHSLWLDRNTHVLHAQQQMALAMTHQEVAKQFQLGLQHLRPDDHFYMTPRLNCFSEAQVHALPLDNQQLWLKAVRNAHLHRQKHLHPSMAQMQQLMTDWLNQPPP